MRRVVLAAALCALALSGCDSLRALFGMPTNDKPEVSVQAGRISVDPKHLHFRNAHGAVVITWKLDDATARAGFRFPDNGIVIDGEVTDGSRDVRPGLPLRPQNEIIECRKLNDHVFQCKNKNSRVGIYKYTIRLLDSRGTPLEPLDPLIVNDL